MGTEQSSFSLSMIPPAEKQDSTTSRIIDGALQSFIEKGFKKTSMEDVASRAGVGRATLYRRFRDKEQLIQSVMMWEAQRNLEELESIISRIESPLEGLIEAFVQAVMRAHRHPLISRLLETEPDEVLPLLTIRLGNFLQLAGAYLAVQITRAQKEGFISELPANTTAEMILRLYHSLILSPEGIINPGNEHSLRLFADTYLRPLLDPAYR